jgi:hypothetical protein
MSWVTWLMIGGAIWVVLALGAIAFIRGATAPERDGEPGEVRATRDRRRIANRDAHRAID